MDENITRRYSNGEITVEWRPAACIHSTVCWKALTGLPEVFNPFERPWIKLENSSTEKIVEQVNKCPSGALSVTYNQQAPEVSSVTTETHVEEIPNGPLMVYGNISVKDKSGIETKKHKVAAFCRCGHSENKPYCDGSHIKVKFKG